MTAVYEIPFVGSIPQTITVTFPNGSAYQLTIQFQFMFNPCWILNIADTSGNLILVGVPLICGANLLAQYGYLNFGVVMYCTVDGDSAGATVPSWGTLGPSLTSHLWIEG